MAINDQQRLNEEAATNPKSDNVFEDEITNDVIQVDGYYVNADTGEVVGLVDKPTEFAVTDEDSANWVLEKLLDLDADLAREDIKKNALVANIEARKKTLQARRNFLIFKFEPQLIAFAQRELEGKTAKSWKSPFGTVKSTTTQGGNVKVKDPEKALAIARVLFKDAVRVTREFMISKLTSEGKAAIKSAVEDAKAAIARDGSRVEYADAFEITETETKWKVDTGVGK